MRVDVNRAKAPAPDELVQERIVVAVRSADQRLLLALLCLASASLAQPSAAPWPTGSHDSGASCAAPPGTPVQKCASFAKFDLPNGGGLWTAIPAPNVYIYGNRNDVVYGYDKHAQKRWSIKLSAACSLLGVANAGPRLYTASVTGLSPDYNLTLSVRNARSGSTAWSFSLPPSLLYPMTLYSTFADAVDVNAAGSIARYEGATGKLLWQQQAAKVEVLLLGPPDGSLITWTANNTMRRDPATGAVTWAQPADLVGFPAALAVGTYLAFADPGHVYAADLATGETLWTVQQSCLSVYLASVAARSTGGAPSLIVQCPLGGSTIFSLLDLATGSLRTQLNTSVAVNGIATVNQTVFLRDVNDLSVYRWEPYAANTPTLVATARRTRGRGVTPGAGNFAIDADGTLLTGEAYLTCHPRDSHLLAIFLGSIGAGLVVIAVVAVIMFVLCRRNKEYQAIT